jgi:hypothetical protein
MCLLDSVEMGRVQEKSVSAADSVIVLLHTSSFVSSHMMTL